MRGEGPGCRSSGLVEADAVFGHSLQVRSGGTLITIKAQVIRSHRVQHDEQYIGRLGRRQSSAFFTPLLDSVGSEDQARLDQDHPQKDRKT